MINAAQADQILQADFANLIKKVKAGKTLTAGERALVEAARSGEPVEAIPARVTSQAELARILGVRRQDIARYRKKPDFPKMAEDGSFEVAACLRWKRENVASSTPVEGEALSKRDQYLAVRIAILDLEYQRRKRELIPVEEIRRELTRSIFAAKRKLFSIPKRVSQILAAEVDAISIEARLEDEIHQALTELASGEWVNEK